MASGFRQIFSNRFIGDDRCPAGQRPPVLRRKSVYVLAGVCLLAILYGTMMPFAGSVESGRFDSVLEWATPGPGDVSINILLYVPVGICIRLLIRRRDRTGGWQIPVTIGLATGLSLLTEYLQTHVPSRVSSAYDVLFNTVGAGIGALLAARAQTVLRNVHAVCFFGLRHRPVQTFTWLLGVAVVISLLAPFDLRLGGNGLKRGLAAAKFTPFPADDYSGRSIVNSTSEPHREMLNDVGTAGMFLAFGFMLALTFVERGHGERRSAALALGVLAPVAAITEAAQILTLSHRFDVWDITLSVISGTLGIALGCKLRERLGARDNALPIQLLGVALAAHFLYVAAHALTPFHFGMKAGALETWIVAPFAGEFDRARNGIPGDCVLELLRYCVLTFLLIAYLEIQRRPVRGWTVVGAVVCLMGGLELFQIFLADRFADTTTPLLALAGGTGAWAMYRALAYDLQNCSLLAGPLEPAAPSLLDRWADLRADRTPTAAGPSPAT